MKVAKLLSVLFVVAAVATSFVIASKPTMEKSPSPTSIQADKKLRHVVMFKFKDSATPADIKKVEDAFRALPSKIKEIKGLEWGTNNSPENLAQGFTHCFFLTFDDEKGRAVYLPHPAHKEFGNVLGPYLDKVLVVDYWTQK